jgi:hypothetical protein
MGSAGCDREDAGGASAFESGTAMEFLMSGLGVWIFASPLATGGTMECGGGAAIEWGPDSAHAATDGGGGRGCEARDLQWSGVAPSGGGNGEESPRRRRSALALKKQSKGRR